MWHSIRELLPSSRQNDSQEFEESEVQEQSNQSEVEVSDDESGQGDHSQLDDIIQSNVLPEPDEDATRRKYSTKGTSNLYEYC